MYVCMLRMCARTMSSCRSSQAMREGGAVVFVAVCDPSILFRTHRTTASRALPRTGPGKARQGKAVGCDYCCLDKQGTYLVVSSRRMTFCGFRIEMQKR